MSLRISLDTRRRVETNNLVANGFFGELSHMRGRGTFTDAQIDFLSRVVNNQQQICASILNIIAENSGHTPQR